MAARFEIARRKNARLKAARLKAAMELPERLKAVSNVAPQARKIIDREAKGCGIAYKYDYMYEFGQCLLVIRMHMNMTGRTLRL